MSHHEPVGNPFKGVVFFNNPITKRIGLYFAFELLPNREYEYEMTTDGITWEHIRHRSTKGMTQDIYESWNVPDPCNGLWPRIRDVGASPTDPVPA